MRPILLLAAASLSAATLFVVPFFAATASARPLHHRGAHPAAGQPAHATARVQRESGFNAGAAAVPAEGFYDGYQGSGATVLKRGVAAQNEPGATSELAPGAKQTATGGPVGGVPGFGGGM